MSTIKSEPSLPRHKPIYVHINYIWQWPWLAPPAPQESLHCRSLPHRCRGEVGVRFGQLALGSKLHHSLATDVQHLCELACSHDVQLSVEYLSVYCLLANERCERHLDRSEERRVGKECRSRWSP